MGSRWAFRKQAPRRARIPGNRLLVPGLVLLAVSLLASSILAATGSRFFGEEIYDPKASTYENLPRPPMFPNDVYSANHPNARPDDPPPEASRPCPGLTENKSLTRTPDHVLVTGNLLPGALGVDLESFRLLAYRANRLEPIPYQIDERNEDGWYVLNEGPRPSGGGNGKLKQDDELVFRIRDTGDRVDRTLWPPGYEKACEIEIVDGLDGGKAWVYLFSFPGDAPARSPEDYVDQIDHGRDGQAYAARTYTIKYPYQSLMWWCIFGTREAGYDETNIIDHGYINLEVKLLGLWNVRITLENMIGTIPCFKDGPVRVIRRTKTRFRVGSMKLPIGLSYDILFYDQYLNIPFSVSVPLNLKFFATSAWGRYGTDLNPNAVGSRWYCNYFPEGVTVTGSPDDDLVKAKIKEVLIKPEDDERYYHLVTGPHGTLMRRHVSTAGQVRDKVETRVSLVDDRASPGEPEYFPGQVGNTMNLLNIRDIPGGKYYALSEWYMCEHFRYPEDVDKYLNIVNHPPTVIVRENGEREVGRGSSSPLAPLFRFQH